jgi:hypothetical protein
MRFCVRSSFSARLTVLVEHPIRRARSVTLVRASPSGFVSRHNTTHAAAAESEIARMVASTKVLIVSNRPLSGRRTLSRDFCGRPVGAAEAARRVPQPSLVAGRPPAAAARVQRVAASPGRPSVLPVAAVGLAARIIRGITTRKGAGIPQEADLRRQ